MSTKWADEQEAFWEWITRPQDLRASETRIRDLLAPHRELSQVEALGIYNNAYHQRLIQISAELYPVTYHTLGHDVYSRLWLEYLTEYPPRPGPMSLLGEHLLTFTRNHKQFGQLPALLSIIELEGLLISLFDLADEAPYSIAQLQSLPPEQWAETRWQPKADWAVINSRFDLERYWAQMQDYLAGLDPQPGATDFGVEPLADAASVFYLVRRVNHRMQFQRINAAMAEFLDGIKTGRTFADICEHLAVHFPDQDIASLSLTLLLKTIELELIKS